MIELRDYVGCQLSDNWWLTRDGDPNAKELFDRHYSRIHYRDGRQPKLFVGPGYKMVLVRPASIHGSVGSEYDAMFVWRDFHSMDHQEGLNCAVFCNESPVRASSLIREAEELAIMSELMPGRFYTYVHPGKIQSCNPGYCFKRAGWTPCGHTRKGLLVLEKFP